MGRVLRTAHQAAGDTYCDTSRLPNECLPWGVGPGDGRDKEEDEGKAAAGWHAFAGHGKAR